MINKNSSKVVVTISFISAIFFSCSAFAINKVENLGVNERLAQSGIFEDWRNGDVFLLIRHEERCDRSSNQCLGPADGITLLGSQQAKKVGVRIQSYFGLDNADIFTSPTTRTIQTAELMLGKSNLLPNREAICGSDVIDKLQKHKTANRNLIVITHSTCIKDLIRAGGYRKLDSSEYGSFLFAKISSAKKLYIFGKLNPDDVPK